MFNICGRCEYRLENIPSGSAESVAMKRGAIVSRVCLQVCSESTLYGIIGVNFEDRTLDGDSQTGTIVMDEDGKPTYVQELYKPVRLRIDPTK